jgi:hypothetical protein
MNQISQAFAKKVKPSGLMYHEFMLLVIVIVCE